ncbi:MAG: PAS domain-containing sensor histidine kinase [Betaproteobacteria bacterium]|nr:PAS domain-containing sensor histidine kinase [Betaproteobacteria bacterium]
MVAQHVLKQPLRLVSQRWINWWRRLSPYRQDRLAVLAPLGAVLVFLAAVLIAFGYLRFEEIEREQESVRRDVEYAQQRLRLELLERQEHLMRMARDLGNRDIDQREFLTEAQSLVSQHPEIASVTWVDAQRRVKASYAGPGVQSAQWRVAGDSLRHADTSGTFQLAREQLQTVYSPPLMRQLPGERSVALMQLHVPIQLHGQFQGVILSEYNIDGLLRFVIPSEIVTRHAISFIDDSHHLLAGQPIDKKSRLNSNMPWMSQAYEYAVPIQPVGNTLLLRAQAYRTSQGLIGNGMFWLMTAWMLIGSWRHTRRRLQAQQALVAETNFRRAMENSILTGMRAMDLNGRITYVNAAFCQMTGWSEQELVGRLPPFPYWPDEDIQLLNRRLQDEINGITSHSAYQVRVKRKNGQVFDARVYMSPLIDAKGQQTGWMTSMTDITEPNRIREQLLASYERFTTVLEALDASVSVAPLGSAEMVFTNKLYRQWFGNKADGHHVLITQAGTLDKASSDDSRDSVDSLAGLPSESLTMAQSENAEIYVPDLDKWLEVRSRYLNWVDGRLAQMVIATDITPRRHAEEQAAQQAERAQSASRLITMGEMASSVAHELNQPLTAISNYCNGMVSRIKGQHISEEDLLKALEKTAHQAQRAGQIIQRIRSFVKRSEPNRIETEVAPMVAEALELADIELKRRSVRLSHFVSSRLPRVHVDPILIEQVLINLLKNSAEAIDHAHRPADRRHVELQVLPKTVDGNPVVEFTVMDTGRGLAPEVLEHLFEAFFSTKTEGMGIGLNLCRSIVESHAGRMQAENLYNGTEITGCRFTFWVPAVTP